MDILQVEKLKKLLRHAEDDVKVSSFSFFAFIFTFMLLLLITFICLFKGIGERVGRC